MAKVTRRNYLKYAGAGVVVVAGAAAGAYYVSYRKPSGGITTESLTSMTSLPVKNPDHLMVSTAGFTTGLDPAVNSLYRTIPINLIYDRLFSYVDKTTPQEWLLQKHSVSDDYKAWNSL